MLNLYEGSRLPQNLTIIMSRKLQLSNVFIVNVLPGLTFTQAVSYGLL